MSTDLLITISGVLKIDFLSFYYSEEPLKSIRSKNCTDQIQKLNEENKQLCKELLLTRELIDALREIIILTKAQIKYIEKTENKPIAEDEIKMWHRTNIKVYFANHAKSNFPGI